MKSSKAVNQVEQNESDYCNIIWIHFGVWIFYICASNRFIFELVLREEKKNLTAL